MRISPLVSVLSCLCVSSLSGESIVFRIQLDPGQEVPAPVGAGGASGDAVVSVDLDSREVSVTGSYRGMSSAVNAAHIHGFADPGVGAGVMVPLTTTGGASGEISGSGMLTEEGLEELLAGRTYVNVHTDNNRSGEIRGQIVNERIGTVVFKFDLSPEQSVPAPVGADDASGRATVTLNTLGRQVAVSGSFENMTSSVIAAHIHGFAATGAAIGVILELSTSGATSGTVSGSGPLTSGQVQGMLDGLTYVNVHTGNNPTGEIRGQIVREAQSDCERGDTDRDGAIAIADVVVTLSHLFLAGPAPQCRPLADANGDGALDVADAIATLFFMFRPGATPLPPLTAQEAQECCPDPTTRGREVYEQPDPDRGRFAVPYSCATCHDIVPDEDAEFLKPGASLHDALHRPTYKLGKLTRFLDAANVCRVDWMETTPWVETDEDFLALEAFLESISPPGPTPALEFEIRQPRVGPVTGDPQAGCELFHRSCVVCHGEAGVGTVLAPGLFFFRFGPDFIRRKIRLSGPSSFGNPDVVYEGLQGGTMPFWGAEKLTDSQVEDITAYLEGRPVAVCR